RVRGPRHLPVRPGAHLLSPRGDAARAGGRPRRRGRRLARPRRAAAGARARPGLTRFREAPGGALAYPPVPPRVARRVVARFVRDEVAVGSNPATPTSRGPGSPGGPGPHTFHRKRSPAQTARGGTHTRRRSVESGYDL